MTEVLTENAINYPVYLEHVNLINNLSPQQQGLSEEEYIAAVRNPHTVNAIVSSPEHGEGCLPQFGPIENYSWLNADYYERQFPDEAAQDSIRHFAELSDIKPSEEVLQGIHELAEKQGVLVFDYPDRGEEENQAFLQKIYGYIEDAGAKAVTERELGTQTYFAGKTSVETHDPDEHNLSLNESFAELGELSVERKDGSHKGAVDYEAIVDPDTLPGLYEGFSEAFATLNDHPCRQGLDPEEFYEMVTEDPEIAKLLYKDDRLGPTTLCMLSDQLEKYPWLNKQYFVDKFPQEAADKSLLYFPAIATDPSKKGEAFAGHIVDFIEEMAVHGNMEPVIAFDCCDMNVGFLDVYLERLINNTPRAEVKFDIIGRQKYAAIKLDVAEH